MAAVTTVNPASIASNEKYTALFNKDLLEGLSYNLVMAKHGKAWPFSANKGSETMRVFRERKANTDGIETISAGATEMTGPTTLTEVARGKKDVSLVEYASAAKISQRQAVVSIFDEVQRYVNKMKQDIALHFDGILRTALWGDLINSAAGSATGQINKFIRFAGVGNGPTAGNGTTRFATFAAAASGDPANTKFTRAAHLGMLAHLSQQQVPRLNGQYPVFMPPCIYGDVLQDGVVVQGMTQVDVQKLWKGGLGYLDGSPIIQHDNPLILSDTLNTTNVPAGDKFGLLYLGAEAFQVPTFTPQDISDPRVPRIKILDQADKTDPHNLYIYLAAKWMYGAATLWTDEATDVPHYGGLFATCTALNN